MEAVGRREDFWIESVIENKSLSAVLDHLKAFIGKPFRITDSTGKVYACSKDVRMISPDDHFVSVPQDNYVRLIYDPLNRILFYRTGFTNQDAWIIISEVDDGIDYTVWLSHLDEVSTAVKIYILMEREKENTEHQLKKKLIEDMLFWNVCNVRDLIKQGKYHLDPNKLYFVSIMEPELNSETDIETLYRHTLIWLRYHADVVICSIWNERYIVFVCPNKYDMHTLESDDNWENYLCYIKKHQRDIMNRFQVSTHFGIGRKYPLAHLHKSYQEALTALNISKLTGKKNSVTHYLEIGMFKLINFQDTSLLKQFCSEVLGKLLEHDRSSKGELMHTLRALFDSNFDVNEAAQKMFIHFNTLRYRMRKIEELTGMRLEQLQDKLNLFVAVKLYDLLMLNGQLGERG